MNTQENIVLLTTAYWAPVSYYVRLYHYPHVVIEQYENYTKQTYRNRCVIAAPDGPLALTVPTEKYAGLKCPMRDIQISDHGNWRHMHWNAFESAYRNSPFFEYYADDFRVFYEKKWKYLIDFNDAIQQKVCELIDLEPHICRTADFGILPDHLLESISAEPWETCVADERFSMTPKSDYRKDVHFYPEPYYQVFSQRHGFLPDLSIADLLFNMGPESILVLKNSFR